MRPVRLVLLAVLACLLGGLTPPAAAMPTLPVHVAVHVCEVDLQVDAVPSVLAERGPPATTYDHSVVPTAVDHVSSSLTARLLPTMPSADGTYDPAAWPALVDGRRGTTQAAPSVIEAQLRLRAGTVVVAAKTGAKACSFAGATVVLMADGSRKPIEDVEVGDKVIATDPETGEQEAKTVTHLWVHDDTVIDLVVDGEVITTTEDHPFWSVTDQTFLRADDLGPGSQALTADGRTLDVVGLAFESTRSALAYNLAVHDIHTYHVGNHDILVHNVCGSPPPNLSPLGTGRTGAFRQAKRDSGVPASMMPSRIGPNYDRRGNAQPGRTYEFDVLGQGGGRRTISIRDDAGGHRYLDDPQQNRGPHFNTENNGQYDY